MTWLVRVELSTIDSELVSSLLWSLNTTGIAELPKDPGDGLSTLATTLVAGFDEEPEAAAAAATLTEQGAGGWQATVEPVDATAWVDPEQVASIDVAGRGLELEVGAAFGHGGHPTTGLVLDLLAANSLLATDRTVVDFGCGTGVLTLAALAHEATTVLAIDNDPAARAMTTKNLARNQHLLPTDRVTVLDQLPAGVAGSGPVDLVLANVLVDVHRGWGPTLAARVAPSGAVIVAGMLEDQRGDVEGAYPGLAMTEERVDGPWLGLLLERP